MPLPRSSASISRPWASPSRSVRRMTSPPRPCLTTFDAASVTAIATLPTTSSTSPAPEARPIAARPASPGWLASPIGTDTVVVVISTAHRRTIWRTRTMSSPERTGHRSLLTIGMAIWRGERDAQQLHALLDVQRRAHTRERQPQLDECDRDRGLHANHHGGGVEDPRHARDVAQHAADERVHDLERRDVDEDAVGPMLDDHLGEVVLKGEGQAVVHVHLYGHEQELPHLENRDALHESCLVLLVDRC